LDARAILVCGLGRLGQHVVATLKEFGMSLYGLDVRTPDDSDVDALRTMLDSFAIGDCRLVPQLQKAGIETCRAIVIVTGDERVNVTAALAARSVSSNVRIVLRSDKRNLNELLRRHLGNFVAFDPTLLSAPAFALSALGGETLGIVRVDREIARVHRATVTADHIWRGRRPHQLNTSYRRVLSTHPARADTWAGFHAFPSDEPIGVGDVVTCIELGADSPLSARRSAEAGSALATPTFGTGEGCNGAAWSLGRFWREAPQIARVAVFCSAVLFALGLGVIASYKIMYPDVGFHDAANVASVLLLGGYDNLFGQLKVPFPIPLWLHAFSVLVSISGTVCIGVVYAFLTERVLSVRFQFFLRRPRLPKGDHVVLVGLSALGIEIARILTGLKRSVVAIGEQTPDPSVTSSIPCVIGDAVDSLPRARIASARSALLLTDDDVTNLEAALSARAKNPACALVIRTDDARLRESVAHMVPGARPLGVLALAAQAFAAAALGENVHELLQVDGRTLLVTEYRVETGDTLNAKLVSDVAYGFGVVPLVLRRHETAAVEFLPPDDARLRVHDTLVVLAAVEGLRNIEQGSILPAEYHVRVEAKPSQPAAFDAALIMARMSGCEVAVAQAALHDAPARFDVPLYRPQAERLARELAKSGIDARVAFEAAKAPVES
jgi:Trk K+ transport system NAD-binding subunit